MKVALCFIINYDHILNKEAIWREWIEYNKDIINVYFFYKDISKIKSEWIRKHAIPYKYICQTSYYHIIPAYISLMNYALSHDKSNQWFCFLTDSCCPIISPTRFRYLFYKYHKKSIINWKEAWWNVTMHKRANLALLPKKIWLANDPYFILKRENVIQCLQFVNQEKKIAKLICDGGLANESLFAIVLYNFNQLNKVIRSATHIVDWSRMMSATSPYLFTEATDRNTIFIEKTLKENNHVMFIRKISPNFPDSILKKYIYEHSKIQDDKLAFQCPFVINMIKYIIISCTLFIPLAMIYFIIFFTPLHNFYINLL